VRLSKYLAFFYSLCCAAQSMSSQVAIGGVGYTSPVLLPVAPGQLITLFVPNSGISLTGPVRAPAGALPTSLAGFSAIFRQGTDTPMPILMVQPISTCYAPGPPPPPPGAVPASSCGATTAVTVQIPFGIRTLCPLCAVADSSAPVFLSMIAVATNGATGQFFEVNPVSDQIRILTSCDVILPGAATSFSLTGLPCQQVVTHADGSTVSPRSPAKGGEVLTAYATGLGQTNPQMITGQPATASAPAQTAFGVDFNYRANALATRPAGANRIGVPAVELLYAGATPGFPGLYQINFVVPPPPAGLAPCVDWTTAPPGINVVQTNLTVSIGSVYSFDGAGICVQAN
jgi:uncharacterized protein (TIGR03437 family)